MSEPTTHRVRFTVHYDGAGFHGWQLQRDQRTVQGEMERVLSRLCNRPTRVVGSGRTDRGVHATGQVAASDVPARWTAAALRRSTNALLPPDVWIAEAALAPARFHPRYDAVERSYRYRVGLAEHARSPLLARWCWPLAEALDLRSVEQATAALLGDHSFAAFAKSGQEERGDRCTVFRAEWHRWPEAGVEFHIAANRFLHHMVRYLVGTLVQVGLGQRPASAVADLLAGRPGLVTSPPAPPQGLFLARVRYADEPEPPPLAAHAAGAPAGPLCSS